jgi:hypothetical protein
MIGCTGGEEVTPSPPWNRGRGNPRKHPGVGLGEGGFTPIPFVRTQVEGWIDPHPSKLIAKTRGKVDLLHVGGWEITTHHLAAQHFRMRRGDHSCKIIAASRHLPMIPLMPIREVPLAIRVPIPMVGCLSFVYGISGRMVVYTEVVGFWGQHTAGMDMLLECRPRSASWSFCVYSGCEVCQMVRAPSRLPLVGPGGGQRRGLRITGSEVARFGLFGFRRPGLNVGFVMLCVVEMFHIIPQGLAASHGPPHMARPWPGRDRSGLTDTPLVSTTRELCICEAWPAM